MSIVAVVQRLPKADGVLRRDKTLSYKAWQKAARFADEVSALGRDRGPKRSCSTAQKSPAAADTADRSHSGGEERPFPALCPCRGRAPPGARCAGGGDPLRPPRPRWRAPAPRPLPPPTPAARHRCCPPRRPERGCPPPPRSTPRPGAALVLPRTTGTPG